MYDIIKTECGEEREREREREREKVVWTVIEVKGEMKVVWSIQPLIPVYVPPTKGSFSNRYFKSIKLNVSLLTNT